MKGVKKKLVKELGNKKRRKDKKGKREKKCWRKDRWESQNNHKDMHISKWSKSLGCWELFNGVLEHTCNNKKNTHTLENPMPILIPLTRHQKQKKIKNYSYLHSSLIVYDTKDNYLILFVKLKK